MLRFLTKALHRLSTFGNHPESESILIEVHNAICQKHTDRMECCPPQQQKRRLTSEPLLILHEFWPEELFGRQPGSRSRQILQLEKGTPTSKPASPRCGKEPPAQAMEKRYAYIYIYVYINIYPCFCLSSFAPRTYNV